MGVATIMILLCHAYAYIELPNLLSKLLAYGNLGVDVFLLCSGFGCYYSLVKRGGSVIKWYKRRLLRIMVPYTLIYLISGFFQFIYDKDNFYIYDYFYVYSTISYWLEHRAVWFIALIIPLYLVTPFMYKWISKSLYHAFSPTLLLLITCSINIQTEHMLIDTVIKNIQIAFVRVPAFLWGIYLGKCSFDAQKGISIIKVTTICLPIYILSHLLFKGVFVGCFLIVPIVFLFLQSMESFSFAILKSC